MSRIDHIYHLLLHCAGNMPTMGYKTYRNFTNNYVNSSNIDRAAAMYHHNAATNNNNNSNGYRKMQPYQRYQNDTWCSYGKGKCYESSADTGMNWRNECRHTVDYDEDSDLNIGLSPPSESMLLQRRIMRRSDIAIRSPPPQTASG